MPRRITTILAAGAVAAALALGASACGDDDDGGSTDAGGGGDESALAQFCSDLSGLDEAVGEFAGLDPQDTTADDVTMLDSDVTGASDTLNLAATGAGIDLGSLSDSLAGLSSAVSSADSGSGTLSADQVGRIQDAADDVSSQIDAAERANCADETGATATDGS